MSMETELLNGLDARAERMTNSLVLAFLGDTVYDLYVRGRLISENPGLVNSLHKQASGLVNAGAQSEALARIEDMLTEGERDIVRRARNAKQNPPKHADHGAYHRATGFEALLGQLYLWGQIDRIDELMNCALGCGSNGEEV